MTAFGTNLNLSAYYFDPPKLPVAIVGNVLQTHYVLQNMYGSWQLKVVHMAEIKPNFQVVQNTSRIIPTSFRVRKSPMR